MDSSSKDPRILLREEYWKERDEIIKLANGKWIVYTSGWSASTHETFESLLEAMEMVKPGKYFDVFRFPQAVALLLSVEMKRLIYFIGNIEMKFWLPDLPKI